MTEALYVMPVSRASAFCIGGFCIHMRAGSPCFMLGRCVPLGLGSQASRF